MTRSSNVPWSLGRSASTRAAQSILVGTPAGVTLSTEGGAHQSIKTPSIGLEQPGCTAYEPAFAVEVEWILLHCLSRLGRPGGRSSYLRLSTRPVHQDLARRSRAIRPRGTAVGATWSRARTRCDPVRIPM
jgi:pyruvate dehydrogenase E1 component